MSLDVSIGGAFVAGLLSFFSPCVLPLVPPYLAYMGGVSVTELRDGEDAGRRWHVMLTALAFVAGFSAVFVALGATASVIGKAVSAWLGVLSYIAGGLIVIMGLHFLGVLRIGLLERTARADVTRKPGGLLGAFVIGLAFGFGWSPCVGPVLAAILLIAGAADSAGEGARLLFVYSLGIGVPFLVAAAFAGAFMRWTARFHARLGLIEKAMGAFLVLAGVLVFTGQMPTIANWLIETLPALGKIG
ncbi:MAG: sulfite exporter TauE/SafE family protein [Proteobacteria bacterium]|nr:sulfite exporter TauE/SafE family protein [Pseudomonadota bacterium]